jgi:pimeloyl-ACP methyl ester carboxylesterase
MKNVVARSISKRQFIGSSGTMLVADVGGRPSSSTVVLLHGGGQTRHSWAATMRALIDAGYRVINFDARGHGESTWSTDGIYSIEARSLDLQTVLANVHGSYALVGASMGGSTALYAASTMQDERIAALILVDIVPNPADEGVQRIKGFMRKHLDGFTSVDEAVDAVAAYNPHRPRPPDPRGLEKNLRRTADGKLKWHWDPKILDLDTDEESKLLMQALDANWGLRPVPTLLIRGAHSDVVVEAGIAELRGKMPNLEVLDVPQAGHMVAGDQNDAFSAGIIDYLQHRLPPSSRLIEP